MSIIKGRTPSSPMEFGTITRNIEAQPPEPRPAHKPCGGSMLSWWNNLLLGIKNRQKEYLAMTMLMTIVTLQTTQVGLFATQERGSVEMFGSCVCFVTPCVCILKLDTNTSPTIIDYSKEICTLVEHQDYFESEIWDQLEGTLGSQIMKEIINKFVESNNVNASSGISENVEQFLSNYTTEIHPVIGKDNQPEYEMLDGSGDDYSKN